MFNEIAKKNPRSLKSKELDDALAKAAELKKDCQSLITKIRNTSKILKMVKIEDKLKSEAIQVNKNKVLEDLNKKYNELTARLQTDYEIEKLSLLKMFMQQELRIFRSEQQVDFYVPYL